VKSAKDTCSNLGIRNPEKLSEKDIEYFQKCFDYIEKIVSGLDLGQGLEQAAKESARNVPVRIRQHYKPWYMAAAAVQVETRKHGGCCPRTVKQVAVKLGEVLESESHLSDYSDHLSRARRATKKLKEYQDVSLDPEMPRDYLPFIFEELEISEETRNDAWNILMDIHRSHELQSKSKIGVAASIILVAAEENSEQITVDELHSLVCRNKKTIRQTARQIQNELLEDSR
jgi:transcription initiation factor TFIIIB Brf1 subunit/transcription initiation factor TFIIB